MSAESTKAMEEALQAAVRRMNGGGGDTPDPIGLISSILPKLLSPEDAEEERDEVLEKLEGLKREDLGTLREQVQLLRKQVHRIWKSHEELLARVKELAEGQQAAADAVLQLARHMARVRIIEELPGDETGEPGEPRAGARGDGARRDPGHRGGQVGR